MKHTEDTRVKLPAILHLIKLGYSYLSWKNEVIKEDTNIFTDIFSESIKRLNPKLSESDINRFYDEISMCLENEDLGKAFYQKLIDRSGIKLIDFDNFNNSFVISKLFKFLLEPML